jgi:peroxiredoxin
VEEFTNLDTTLITLSPELIENNRSLIEKKKLKFEMLRDLENEVAQAYGLRWNLPSDLKKLYLSFGIDLAAANGESSWTLAVPATFIIDKTGVVRYVNADPDYTRRPEPQDTLEALKRIAR